MVLQCGALDFVFLKENMQVVCTVLCMCMISTGCSYDHHIFRLSLKLGFSTKKCVHAFMVFELIGLKPVNRSAISSLKCPTVPDCH